MCRGGGKKKGKMVTGDRIRLALQTIDVGALTRRSQQRGNRLVFSFERIREAEFKKKKLFELEDESQRWVLHVRPFWTKKRDYCRTSITPRVGFQDQGLKIRKIKEYMRVTTDKDVLLKQIVKRAQGGFAANSRKKGQKNWRPFNIRKHPVCW